VCEFFSVCMCVRVCLVCVCVCEFVCGVCCVNMCVWLHYSFHDLVFPFFFCVVCVIMGVW